MTFKKAERKRVKIKLAIAGPSGSGKTFSALRLAKGLGGKIALIDTENGSASLYSDKFDFDSMELSPPYTTDRYVEAINAAVKAGYNVLIIDSITHQWDGEGGILNKKAKLDSIPGSNSYTNWNTLTPEHERFKSAMLHSDIHLIATVRSKQDYILAENGKGKMAPKKVGMAPVQRDGMEYEFTVFFDVNMNHDAQASKDRTDLFINDNLFKITEETGRDLEKWLASAPMSRDDIKKKLTVIGTRHQMSLDHIADEIKAQTGKEGKDLTDEEYVILGETFEQKLKINREFDKPKSDWESFKSP